MKKESDLTGTRGLTRRTFIKGGTGAIVAVGCLSHLRASAAVFEAHPTQSPAAKAWVCPPCGMPCDKLTFDKPGHCPNCNLTLVLADGEGGLPRVVILVFDSVELIDFAGPWEVFGTAGFPVHTVAEKLDPISVVFGQKMIPDYTFDNAPKAEILLVPGGGVFQHLKNEKLIGWIQDKSKQVSHVMSVCTGAFLLQKAGLLVGQTVTATNGMIEDLATADTRVVYDRRFVDNGKILTTAGLSSGIDGAFHLVSRLAGLGSAQRAALSMEYPWEPDGKWARAALADKYTPRRLNGAEATIVSFEGDTNRWETKFLVTQPRSAGEIVAVLRESVRAHTAMGGMFKPVSHMRGAPALQPARAKDPELRWKFTDDQGRNWTGVGSVEPAPDNKFIATLKIVRQS